MSSEVFTCCHMLTERGQARRRASSPLESSQPSEEYSKIPMGKLGGALIQTRGPGAAELTSRGTLTEFMEGMYTKLGRGQQELGSFRPCQDQCFKLLLNFAEPVRFNGPLSLSRNGRCIFAVGDYTNRKDFLDGNKRNGRP